MSFHDNNNNMSDSIYTYVNVVRRNMCNSKHSTKYDYPYSSVFPGIFMKIAK